MSANSTAKRTNVKKEMAFFWTEKTINKSQKPKTGEIRASSIEHARHLLVRQGIRAASIKKTRTGIGSKVDTKTVAVFVRQLSVMIKSGVPLGQSLSLISSNMKGRRSGEMQRIIRAIRADVESGSKLSDSMRKHPKCFDILFCNTLEAGENAGELDVCLDRLATFIEKALRVRQKVKKAMVYPGIVMFVAVALTLGMLLFIMPSFKSVYSQFNAQLPALTQGLLDASDFLKANGFLALVILIVFIYAMKQLYQRQEGFRDGVENVLMKMPLFGELLRTAALARWMRTFSTLSATGVPIVQALESVASVAQNKKLEVATIAIRQAVATGVRVSDSMERTEAFPQEAVQMIRIGEDSGRLDSMVAKLAEQYETKLDDMVETLSTVIEPMIMAVIGGLVGTLIIGMYMPIFNLGAIV